MRPIDSDIGRKVNFTRLAVHYVVLPPQCRTSTPHAESHEEEFVYVIKGNPHLWLNGYIHELKSGHAIGFPSGTGVAHTFINNTSEEIHLLVAGEKTKKDNWCFFPINPEKKKDCTFWWDNPPQHKLGPHSGLPGPVGDTDKTDEKPDCIIFCPEVPRQKSFHYPGDNETFGEGFRITNKVGLKVLGIWYEHLLPGRRSAFPHAHTHEEEFVLIIQGKPTVWIDGFTKELSANEFAAFPSNTGHAHTLINDTDDEVIYLCIGETQEFPEEKILYPLNPLRRKECERKNWYWHNAPSIPLGKHNGKPERPIKDHLAFKLCTEADIATVLEIYKESSRYFQKFEGCLPTEMTVRNSIADEPRKKSEKYFKEFLIIESDSRPVGAIDLHAHHPEVGTCYLRLLLIRENYFGQGLGSRCFKLAEDYIMKSLECDKIKLGISNDNDVTEFWLKMGFEFSGKTYNWEGKEKSNLVKEYIKDISIKKINDWSKFKLVTPSLEYRKEFIEGLAGITNQADRLAWVYLGDNADDNYPVNNFASYVATLNQRASTPPDGFVCDNVYWAIYDGKMVGRISIRHELNDFLRKVGGHIGYIVHPAWRNKGIASWMLGETLKTDRAKKIGKLLLTCDEDNIPSIKTIIKNGGKFDKIVDLSPERKNKKHFWIFL